MHIRPQFYPCDHDGRCDGSLRCTCCRDKVYCEKYCRCAGRCHRVFQGCTCKQSSNTCGKDTSCTCFLLNRECDPDLCHSCGCKELLDPANRVSPNIARVKCRNVGLQRNVPKSLFIGDSTIANFGLYSGELIHADEYISEYKGETLTDEESNRRDEPYLYTQTLYLFTKGTQCKLS